MLIGLALGKDAWKLITGKYICCCFGKCTFQQNRRHGMRGGGVSAANAGNQLEARPGEPLTAPLEEAFMTAKSQSGHLRSLSTFKYRLQIQSSKAVEFQTTLHFHKIGKVERESNGKSKWDGAGRRAIPSRVRTTQGSQGWKGTWAGLRIQSLDQLGRM